jgi:TolB-like protein
MAKAFLNHGQSEAAAGQKLAGSAPADTESAAPPPVRPELVQRHLEKVLVSAEMSRSKKLCQFLRFTVEEVLRGHGSELKEYAIAVGVFRRSREFDPGADPIVRVQARRLRSKLGRYYQNEGSGEPIQIDYPVGGYSPVFLRRTPQISAEGQSVPGSLTPESDLGCCVAVLPFAGVGPEATQAFTDGLTDELMHALSVRPGIFVAARTSCYQFKDKTEDVRRIGERLGVGALVTGTVRQEGGRLRVLVQLIDARTGMNLWSVGYEWELESTLEAQRKISTEVSEVLQLHLGKLEMRPVRSDRNAGQHVAG